MRRSRVAGSQAVDGKEVQQQATQFPVCANIDRIAREGASFTDTYAQQSRTAEHAAFVTGQSPFRTELLRVSLPGTKQGFHDKDPTSAEMLIPSGYATAQIWKKHLGDRNDYLPTMHGFDDFFGNLYHLNSEEEPEDPQYLREPKTQSRVWPTRGPRMQNNG